MCKKLCFLILSVLMLSLTSTSYGEVVIGNFEEQMDGWAACSWGPPGNPDFSYSETGVTLDSYSLVAMQPTDGFNWFLINTNVNGNAFRANNIISIDVTRIADEWTRGTGDHWCYLDLRVQDNRRYALTGLGNRGDWDSNDLNANDKMTLTWDYTLFKRQMPAAATGVEIVIATNTGGYTGMGIWYIDNIQLLASRNEQPRNGAWGEELNPTLKWAEASPSDKFDVYVGTNFNDVNDASRASHPFLLYYSQNQDPNNCPLSGTTNGTTYYWRIDDVIGGTPVKGTVWHFTTFLPGAKSTVIGDWERRMDGWVAVNPNDPNVVLDYSPSGATLHDYSLSVDVALSTWYETVEIPLDETGFTYQFLANNRFALDVTRDTSEFGTNIHSITINGDGIGGLQLAPMSETLIGSQGGLFTRTFTWDYSAIDFSLLPAEPDTLTLSIATMSGGLYHFDNARLYSSRVASDPMPADNAADVQREPTLSWTPGEGARIHDVYFGSDFNDVNDAAAASHPNATFVNTDVNSFKPGTLEFNTTYYWRIDEVNEIVWKGAVWSFTIGRYLVVDDFEDYNDIDNKIFMTWEDYAVNNTGMTVGHIEPPFAERQIVSTGYQSMYMRYDNDGTVNEGTDLEQKGTLFYSEAQRQWAELQDWTQNDANLLTLWFRGVPASVGSFTTTTTGYTMTAKGSDIYSTADQCHFAYVPFTGAGEIIAKVESIDNTNAWAKAGVMIRETLNADSANIALVVTAGSGVSLQHRPASGSSTEVDNTVSGIVAPQWLRLRRNGNTFTGEYSADKANWKPAGSVTLTLGANIIVGLCLTSHNVDAVCTAKFSNVAVNSAAPSNWSDDDVGIESNVPERLYVVLEDSAGISSPAVTYSNPAATTIATYTPWNIPLTSFTGVNLTAITKMTIGVGDRASTQPGSAGTLYIDDIRLLLPQAVN